ncbi:hypothetical protein Hanom_Chr11g00999751 [Helianthus anomalus]
MKRFHFNIARLAKIDPKEIMKPIPVEYSHLEVPKPIRLQSINPPITQAGTTSMGPPPYNLKGRNVEKVSILVFSYL